MQMSAAPFSRDSGVSFLAPMQDITDAGFMQAVAVRGAPDFYIAEYFRIHEYFELEPHVLESVLWNPERDCLVGATAPMAVMMDLLKNRIGATDAECRAIGHDNPLELIGGRGC